MVNRDSITNNNSKDNIFEQIYRLEEKIRNMNEYLKCFNDNHENIDSIPDEYILKLICTNQININNNYYLVDADFLIKNQSVKLKILDYLYQKNFSFNKGNRLQSQANIKYLQSSYV